MNKKKIFLLAFMFVLMVSSTAYAAAESVTAGETNAFTLEQVKSLVKDNSRSLQKYVINVETAKYKEQQANYERDGAYGLYDTYNSLANDLGNAYAKLAEAAPEEQAAIITEIGKIENQRDAQYDKIKANQKSADTAKDSYNDAVKEEANYRKQVDYIVEELYTSILNQEEDLLALQKELELQQYLLKVERSKMGVGSSSQAKVDELAVKVNELNKKIITQSNSVMIKKGQLNDLMGKNFDDGLKLVPFEVSTTIELPEYKELLSSATYSYQLFSQLNRDLNQLDDDLDDENDYYQRTLLRQEIKGKELDLADAKQKLQETINNLLADVKTKQEDYQVALANYRNAQRSYEWTQKRYEMGQISKLALLESELNYVTMQNKKVSAGYTLYLTQGSLKLAAEGIVVN